uniref:Peptidase A2 domain-containing protein n=1 Tax=Knipowitschia caucasica TaxID=637954 RepID=A0AAV2LWM4_KNICA
MTFKLDTGADVTVIPAATYSKDLHGPLTRAVKPLCGPSGEALKVRGFPAISALGLLHPVDSVTEFEADIKQLYPKVFTGLGLLKGAYKVKLKEGQRVWVKNTNSSGIISSPANTPRSYNIDLPTGRLRRNRSHITVIPEGTTVTRLGRVVHTPQRLNI